MKIALYIEDGLEQLVLTPEGNHEKSLLGLLANGTREIQIKQGRFFENQLGWIRHTSAPESTMIVLRPAPQDAASFSPENYIEEQSQ